MSYTIEPLAGMSSRISEMTLRSGKPIDDNKKYKVAGWATVGSQSDGAPVWDVVADYCRDKQTVYLDRFETPHIKGVSNNQGIADYSGLLS